VAVIDAVAESARYWLRRELARAGLDGTISVRIVNPRAQGWLAGFVAAVGDALSLDDAKRYELEARLYVSLFEGTPMGEQLGLEALQMAKQIRNLPGASGSMLADWDEQHARGSEGGRHFVGLLQALESFGDTLR
jgi:hypothetical protein